MKQQITIYEKPTCSTCRQVMMAFKERGIAFDAINYIIEPIPAKKLKEIIEKIDVAPGELIRTKEPEFKTLNIDAHTLTKKDVLAILTEHPALIQRPIIEIGKKCILGRPVAKVQKFLSTLE